MKFVLLFLLTFFVLSVFSASGCINWFKDLAKNWKQKNIGRIRDSLFAFAFALFFAPVIQLITSFVVNIAFGIFNIPAAMMIFWFLLFLAAEQFFYEWGIQLLVQNLIPKVINGILKKFGLLKEENNGADTANTNGND